MFGRATIRFCIGPHSIVQAILTVNLRSHAPVIAHETMTGNVSRPTCDEQTTIASLVWDRK